NIDVVRGAGPVIGDEAVQADVAQLDASARAVADIMTDADPGAVKVLADHGITSVYAPYAEPLVARRMEAMPDLNPAGSDRSGSRVWRTELEVSEPREQSRPWNFVIAAGQTVAWLIVSVLAVPGRNATGEAVRDHELLGPLVAARRGSTHRDIGGHGRNAGCPRPRSVARRCTPDHRRMPGFGHQGRDCRGRPAGNHRRTPARR